MIGVLITGHGEYANGMRHAAEMIGGKAEHLETVLFKDDVDLGVYRQDVQSSMKNLLKKHGSVLVLTDLLGGTPFNTAVIASHGMTNVRVIAGTNLSLAIEGIMLSKFSESVEDLARQLIDVGRTGIQMYEEPQQSQSIDDLEESDGI